MITPPHHLWLDSLIADPEWAAFFTPEAELERLLQIEAAWTRALGAVEGKSHSEKLATQIATAKVSHEILQQGVAKDGVPIPALVKTLQQQFGEDAPIHRGLTSQDAMDTSLILVLAEILVSLIQRLQILDGLLAEKQQHFGAATVMAFTRMQPAIATTVSEVIGRWRQPFAPMITATQQCLSQTKIIQWGGPIGNRDNPEAHRLGGYFAQHLGLSDPGQAWHTDRTPILAVAEILSRVAVATGKIGEDVALMAALGSTYLTLQGGKSSAMAHKNNPIKAETLIALADFTALLHSGLIRAARHEGFRSGKAWMMEWLILPQFCLATGYGTRLLDQLLNDILTIGIGTTSNAKS